MSRIGMAALGVAAAMAAPAFATDEEIIALFEENGAAWAAARFADADRAGEAAWRQAEEEWGAVEDTANLAEILTQQRLLVGDHAGAREPARRLAELAAVGAAPAVPAAFAQFYVALAEFDPAAPTEDAADALEAGLRAAEGAGMPPGRLLWTGWLLMARALRDEEAWGRTYEAGHRVMNVMDLADGVPDGARVEAAILAGGAALQEREFPQAQEAYYWALEYVPRYQTVDGAQTLNPDWARIAAWALAMEAMNETLDEETAPVGDIYGLDMMVPEQTCPSAAWTVRTIPEYPNKGLERSVVGAAIIEYALAPDGSVAEARVAAEAPDGVGFGGATLEALETWKADPDTIADCVGRKMVLRAMFFLPSSLPF